MQTRKIMLAALLLGCTAQASAICPWDANCLNNPYGAGSRYKADGLNNPYSQYGSKISNKSWNNPMATDAPKVYDAFGNYMGRLTTNRMDPDAISNQLIMPGMELFVVPQ
jgi:hypothetical protein